MDDTLIGNRSNKRLPIPDEVKADIKELKRFTLEEVAKMYKIPVEYLEDLKGSD